MCTKPGFAQPVEEIKWGHGRKTLRARRFFYQPTKLLLINGRFNHFAALHHKRDPA